MSPTTRTRKRQLDEGKEYFKNKEKGQLMNYSCLLFYSYLKRKKRFECVLCGPQASNKMLISLFLLGKHLNALCWYVLYDCLMCSWIMFEKHCSICVFALLIYVHYVCEDSAFVCLHYYVCIMFSLLCLHYLCTFVYLHCLCCEMNLHNQYLWF